MTPLFLYLQTTPYTATGSACSIGAMGNKTAPLLAMQVAA